VSFCEPRLDGQVDTLDITKLAQLLEKNREIIPRDGGIRDRALAEEAEGVDSGRLLRMNSERHQNASGRYPQEHASVHHLISYARITA